MSFAYTFYPIPLTSSQFNMTSWERLEFTLQCHILTVLVLTYTFSVLSAYCTHNFNSLLYSIASRGSAGQVCMESNKEGDRSLDWSSEQDSDQHSGASSHVPTLHPNALNLPQWNSNGHYSNFHNYFCCWPTAVCHRVWFMNIMKSFS